MTDKSFQTPKERSFEIIQKYVHVKPEIQQEVETFIDDYFTNHFVIGVHHRGTDKKLEVPIIPYEKTAAYLDSYIQKLPPEIRKKLRIYVATDEEPFLHFMLMHYSTLIVYNDFIRSKNGNPIHYSENLYGSNYQKGKEALIDCLLLARCQFLIYPAAASLSISALKFNPYLQSISPPY